MRPFVSAFSGVSLTIARWRFHVVEHHELINAELHQTRGRDRLVCAVALCEAILIVGTGDPDQRSRAPTGALAVLGFAALALAAPTANRLKPKVRAFVCLAAIATLAALIVIAARTFAREYSVFGRQSAGDDAIIFCIEAQHGTPVIFSDHRGGEFRIPATTDLRAAAIPSDLSELSTAGWIALRDKYGLEKWLVFGSDEIPSNAKGDFEVVRCPS